MHQWEWEWPHIFQGNGAIKHQYDHLVKKAKKQDGRSKRDEEIDVGENDHDYDDLDEEILFTIFSMVPRL